VEFNLADLFESVVDTVPGAVAVVTGERRLRYVDLEARANRLAHALAAAGVGPGDFVGLQLPNGSEYLEGMLACFKLRAVPINVSFRYLESELRYLYRDAGLVGLIFPRSLAAAVGAAAEAMAERRVMLEVDDTGRGERLSGAADYEDALAGYPDARDFGPRFADDVYCVYTGGSTGLPKGVLWRHEDIFFAAMGGGDALQLGNPIARPEELPGRVLQPGLVALCVPPLIHSSAQWLAFSEFFGGGTLVLLPTGHFDPVAAWRLLARERANIVVIVGDAMAQPLLDALESGAVPADDHASLMVIGSGGAILSRSTRERVARLLPNVIVVDGFGSSETGQMGGTAPPKGALSLPRMRVDERTTVFDDKLRPVVPGSSTVGHLGRGGRLPLGYHGDPIKTAATFVTVGGRRWAMPGDLAMVEADGTIVVLGRASQCINTGGEKVYPEEVEAALRGHPNVADALVVGVPDELWGERVVAVVEPRPGSGPTLDALRAFLRGELASYKLPKQLILVERLERLPSGKPDYQWATDAVHSALKEVCE